MKKAFSISIALFTMFSAKAQTPADGYLHIQSLNPGHSSFINDSIYISLRNKNNLTYCSKNNINSMKWEHIAAYPNNELVPNVIVMKDELNGVTFSGGLKYTNDGGASFTNSNITFGVNGLTPVNIYNTPNGYLAVYRLNNNNSYLYHSSDGVDWVNSREGGIFSTPSFVGDTIYYRAGSSINISPDGGITFPFSDFLTPQSLPATFTFFHAVSHNIFIGGNADNVYRTTDGGANWTPITFNPVAFGFVGAVFKNQLEGIIYQGVNGGFRYTTDGGETWATGTNSPGVQQSPSFYFVGDKLFNSGFGSKYTTDWGQNWVNFTNSTSGSPIHDISFHNNLGIYVGSGGEYGVTVNGGYYFYTPTAPFSSERLSACAAINDTLLLAGNFKGEVYRSVNQGLSWEKVFTNTQNNTLQSFRWSNDGKVFCVRNFTGPIISTNYGATYQTISETGNYADFNTSGILFSVSKQSSNLIVRRHNTPYSNANTTEIASFAAGTFEIDNFIMANDNVGYILGKDGSEKLVTYRTTNGGTTWSRQNGLNGINISFSLSGAKVQAFGDEKIAVAQENFVVNDPSYNKLFLSNNGAANWNVYEYENPGAPEHDFTIHGTHFFDSDKFILGGNNGLMYLNYLPGGSGTTTSIAEIMKEDDELPVSIFPNPTSAELNIRLYELDTNEKLQMTLINALGQVVQTNPLNSNITTISLDNLPAGIYIYRIENNQKLLRTGKVILSK